MRELYTANLFWLDFSQLWNRICQIKQITFCVGIWRWKSLQKKVVYIRPGARFLLRWIERHQGKFSHLLWFFFSLIYVLCTKKQPWSWFGFMIKRNHLPDYDWLFRSCHESESQLRIPCQFNQARLRNVFWIDGQPFTRILVSRRLIQMAVRRKMDIDSRSKIWTHELFYWVHISPNVPICRLEKTFFSRVKQSALLTQNAKGSELNLIRGEFYLLDIVDFAFMILRSFPSIG